MFTIRNTAGIKTILRQYNALALVLLGLVPALFIKLVKLMVRDELIAGEGYTQTILLIAKLIIVYAVLRGIKLAVHVILVMKAPRSSEIRGDYYGLRYVPCLTGVERPLQVKCYTDYPINNRQTLFEIDDYHKQRTLLFIVENQDTDVLRKALDRELHMY